MRTKNILLAFADLKKNIDSSIKFWVVDEGRKWSEITKAMLYIKQILGRV